MIKISCPTCRQRLFDLEPDSRMGREIISIKCPRCRAVAAIKLKRYERTEQIAAQ